MIDVACGQDTPNRDPMLEFSRYVTELLGLPVTESPVEQLAFLEVGDDASHRAALAYLTAVTDVQDRTRTMCAALTG